VNVSDITTQFHVISFEGPDAYSRAGGIASRITGLTRALAEAGSDTHLWFVGDPDLPGHEVQGRLTLHRWCQWISRYHPEGVYDGEEGKRADFVDSLPLFLAREILIPRLRSGYRAVILAEEWQTADAVLHLDWLLRQAGLRDRVLMLWNANNTFSFERIDWGRLVNAAVITTVSRYMKHLLRGFGVDALVISNGLSSEALIAPARDAVNAFRHRLRDRVVLSKVARFDPDKRWSTAIDIVGELKRQGLRPLLLARGGIEPYGTQILSAAAASGLRVADRSARSGDARGVLGVLDSVANFDIVNLRMPLTCEGRRLLFRGSSAVLANSGHEPFGLVGLETMAVGGVACTGCSGEDYAVPGHNALVLETSDPQEFVGLFRELRAHPERERAIRRAGQLTAKRYTWTGIVQRALLPRLRVLSAS